MAPPHSSYCDQVYDLVMTTKLDSDMTGLQLISSLRVDHTLCHTPVLYITKDNGQEDIALAIKCGAANYLISPYTDETLAQLIGQAMEKPRPSA
jgi:CheY-like chemotaxis protein